MVSKRRSSSNLQNLVLDGPEIKIFKPTISNSSTKWSISPDIVYDTLSFLERNEVEKCQLLSKFMNSIISTLNRRLPFRDFKDYDLVVNKNKAFFLQNPPYSPNGKYSYPVENINEVLCLQYCYVAMVRIHEFDWNVWLWFDKIKKICDGEKLKVKEFRIFGQFSNVTLLKELPLFFEDYVHANNLTIHLTYPELRYVLSQPEALRLPYPPENFTLVDSYGDTSLYKYDPERYVDMDDFLNFLGDSTIGVSNRKKALFSCMNKNMVEMDFCEKYVRMFESSPNPACFFTMIEIWCESDSVVVAENYIQNRKCEHRIITDPFPGPSFKRNFNTYTIKRSDGWSLRVMLEKIGCSMIKFWVLQE